MTFLFYLVYEKQLYIYELYICRCADWPKKVTDTNIKNKNHNSNWINNSVCKIKLTNVGWFDHTLYKIKNNKNHPYKYKIYKIVIINNIQKYNTILLVITISIYFYNTTTNNNYAKWNFEF